MNTQAQQRVDALVSKAKSIIDGADLEDRGRTADENVEVSRLIKEISDLRQGSVAADMDRIGRQIGAEGSGATDPSYAIGGGPGDTFVKPQGYKRISDPAARSSRWSSKPVEVKATLLQQPGGVATR